MPNTPPSPDEPAEDTLEEFATSVSIERTSANLRGASRLLSLLNVARDVAKQSAKDARADERLARDLLRQAEALGKLSDRLGDAMSAYGDRHHPPERIIREIRSAATELAAAP